MRMSIFSDLAQVSSAAVDTVMGERLRLAPLIPGRSKAAMPDPDRQAADVVGVHREFDRPTKIDTSETGRDMNRVASTRIIVFSIDNDAIEGQVFRKGDRVIRLELAGEPAFEISEIKPDGGTRTGFHVVTVQA
jgi:hypothetical protein